MESQSSPSRRLAPCIHRSQPPGVAMVSTASNRSCRWMSSPVLVKNRTPASSSSQIGAFPMLSCRPAMPHGRHRSTASLLSSCFDSCRCRGGRAPRPPPLARAWASRRQGPAGAAPLDPPPVTSRRSQVDPVNAATSAYSRHER